MSMEVETTYCVQYQKQGEEDWFSFTGPAFTKPVGPLNDETHDFNEAFRVARDLYDGKILTDDRPKYRAYVTRTRVIQRIYAGGTVITFGPPPAPEPEPGA